MVHGVRPRAEEVCRAGQSSGGHAAAGGRGGVRPTVLHPGVQHDGLHRPDQGERLKFTPQGSDGGLALIHYVLKNESLPQGNRADIVTLDAGEVYSAVKQFSLVVIAKEIYSEGEGSHPQPCVGT